MLAALLILGCASNRITHVVPEHLKQRAAYVAYKVSMCMNEHSLKYAIVASDKPNAFVNADGNIIYTEGILAWNKELLYFVTAHEIAHHKLKHIQKERAVSIITTGAMMVAGFIVPGAGYLNHAVNPAICNNFSKSQELDADKFASKTLLECFNIPVEKQTKIMQFMKESGPDAGGFWDRHPSWDDRIKNLQSP